MVHSMKNMHHSLLKLVTIKFLRGFGSFKFNTPENISGDERILRYRTELVLVWKLHEYLWTSRVPLGGLYAKVGYASVDAVVKNTSRSGVTYPDADIDGYTVAFGWDQEL